ncbi:hypothetical protein [Microviridae sp.]|nr:hypothetical protein [Microviridae sp.]
MLEGIISAVGAPLLKAGAQAAGDWVGNKVPGLKDAGLGGIGSAIGSNLGEMLGPSSGKVAGRNANDYFKEIGGKSFNPWDKLGGPSPGGQLAAVDKQVKTQQELQKNELQNRKDIANIQGQYQLKTAQTALGGDNTPEPQMRRQESEIQRVEAEIENIAARTATERSQAKLKEAEAELAQAFAYARLVGAGGISGAAAGMIRSLFPKLAQKYLSHKAIAAGVTAAAATGGRTAIKHTKFGGAAAAASRRIKGIGSTHKKTPMQRYQDDLKLIQDELKRKPVLAKKRTEINVPIGHKVHKPKN